MRWKARKGKIGMVVERKFLLLPKRLDGEWRWLEFADIRIEYWLGRKSGIVWRDELGWGKGE